MITYDLYTVDGGNTLMATDIHDGFECAFVGSKQFFVRSTNSLGEFQDSNIVTGSANEKPVITIAGDQTYDYVLNTIYVDAGAAAQDTQDGDITLNIVRSGNTDAEVNAGIIGDTFAITYDVVDVYGLAADTKTRNIEVINTKPIITLVGTSPITLSPADTYTDAGAIAVDNEDGDVTSSIIRVGATDAQITAGVDGESFTILYNVDDSLGMAADTVTRTINIVNQRPIITLLGTTPVSHLNTDTYIDDGATAIDYEDGDITGSIIRSGDTDIDINAGLIGESFTILYDVEDSNGLAATTISRIVDIV